jgi:hypothetical protein
MAVLSDSEAIDLIRNLLIQFVPPGLDLTNALEHMDALDSLLLEHECPKCGSILECFDCH